MQVTTLKIYTIYFIYIVERKHRKGTEEINIMAFMTMYHNDTTAISQCIFVVNLEETSNIYMMFLLICIYI